MVTNRKKPFSTSLKYLERLFLVDRLRKADCLSPVGCFVMSVGNSTIVHDVVIFIRDLLRNNLTDPKDPRPSDKAPFVMTSYPEKGTIYYPHVIVYQAAGYGSRLGVNATFFKYNQRLRIDILSNSAKELDELTDQVIYQLRNQISSINDYGIWNLQIVGFHMNPLPLAEKPYRKTVEIECFVYPTP